MSQQVEIIDLGFSIADAKDIAFKFDGSDLIIEFNDWKEEQIFIRCENTLGFKYQVAEYEIDESERFDSCHIVNDSDWMKEHLKQGEVWENESWIHYKLNFNAAGVVEVQCSKLARTYQ